MRILPTTLLAGGLATLVACGSEHGSQAAEVVATPEPDAAASWPSFRGDTGMSGVAAGTLPAELELLWTYEAGGAITSSPAVVDGRVVFGSDDYHVHSIDAETGAGLWTFATEDIIEAPPLVVDGSVYIGSSDFFLYALDAETGALRWKYETDDKILGGANYVRTDAGLRIVVGSYDTKLYGFDAETGEKQWSYSTDNYVNGTPAVLDGKAIFGGCDAVLHVVDTETGEAAGRVELGSDCHVAGSVALEDGRVYFGHYGNQFVCIDLEREEIAWTYDSPRHAFFSSAAIGTDRIVFGGRDKHLHCARKSDGEPIWKFATRRKVDGSPVIVGDAVVFGSGDGRMHVLALADGTERWSYDIGQSIISSPAVVNGRIYVGANDGRLYAFGAVKKEGER